MRNEPPCCESVYLKSVTAVFPWVCTSRVWGTSQKPLRVTHFALDTLCKQASYMHRLNLFRRNEEDTDEWTQILNGHDSNTNAMLTEEVAVYAIRPGA
jgi:hypothetical protein